MYNLDANHRDIVEAFRQCACNVAELAKSKSDVPGLPDLLIGIPDPVCRRFQLVLVEVKTPEGRLSADQRRFFLDWVDYPVHVVRSIDDVVRVIRQYRE
jgi:hypothetical protein